jgi:hypothetical protein
MKNVAFQYAHTLGRFQQLQSFGALVPFRVRQSVDTFHPRYLFLPQNREHRASTWLLPDTLQHSILSLWLRATQVEIAPTCFQTISSTHVHDFVRLVFGFLLADLAFISEIQSCFQISVRRAVYSGIFAGENPRYDDKQYSV